MPWQPIDASCEGDSDLALFAKDGRFMIRANGLELMNGFSHDSETEFGRLAAEMATAPRPRILIGGLGLGYTLAGLMNALGQRGEVTVAEFSASVIAWFSRYLRPALLPRAPDNLTIVETDVGRLLGTGQRYDLILLDVDNGPEPLVRGENAALYAETGLRAMSDSLAETGAVLLWSGFQSDGFEATARQAGFSVRRRSIANGARAELDHHIYLLEKAR
jgi:spermidine synthase